MRIQSLCLCITAMWTAGAAAGDWAQWRGAGQDGFVRETAAVMTWSQDGENLLWKSDIGGRTTPIVLNGRVYFNAPVGEGQSLQERVVCLDADSGELLWEHRFNVFLSTIVENRVGWSAMVGDLDTGNVYVHGTGGELICFDRDGNVKWKKSLTEEFGRISGYGGRLHTPIIDGDRIIISFSNSSWGKHAKPLHRYLALDKYNGEPIWWSAPGVMPIDKTCYSTPVTALIEGRRMLIAANGDGFVYGMDARTGERLWKFQLSKRGLNSTVVVDGKYVYVSHSEENVHSSGMGGVVCIDASKRGDLTGSGAVWRVEDLKVGYASPALGNGRLYVVDNSANLHAIEASSGRKLWKYNFGRVGKGSPVVTADGVIYVAGQNGSFHILRDEGDRCVSLDKELFTRPDGLVNEIYGSPAVVDGRVYFITRDATYCLAVPGSKTERLPAAPAGSEKASAYADQKLLQITPADVTVSSGREMMFFCELHEGGRVQVDPEGLKWSVEGIEAEISSEGGLKVSATGFATGHVVARLGDLEARARVRFSPRFGRRPLTVDFEDLELGSIPAGWVGITGKTKVVERDGSKVLMKMADKPSVPFTRIRGYITPPVPFGYTIEADLLGAPKGKRFKPDIGLINTRYTFIMRGNAQKLRLVSWSPIPRIQKDVPFEWSTDTWYRVKFQVESREGDGVIRAKVWPRGQEEPEAWSIEMTDAYPNREGSAGIYGYSTGTTSKSKGTEIFYDNITISRNPRPQ